MARRYERSLFQGRGWLETEIEAHSSRLAEFGGRGMSFNICRGILGSLAMFTANRNASSRVSSLAAAQSWSPVSWPQVAKSSRAFISGNQLLDRAQLLGKRTRLLTRQGPIQALQLAARDQTFALGRSRDPSTRICATDLDTILARAAQERRRYSLLSNDILH